jgi:hypothetical protein
MADPPSETPAEKLRLALQLAETAERMLRQRLRRESPTLSDDDIEQRVAAWYSRRPGAELGDGEGRPAPWPRR